MFDPTYPPEDAEIESAPLRSQFNALNDDIQSRPTQSQMNAADEAVLQQTSANTNSVGQLGLVADGSYQPWQLQAVADKLDEMLAAMRRSGGGP